MTRRVVVSLVIVVMVGVLIWQFRHAHPATGNGDKRNTAATAKFSFKDLNGAEINSENYKGRVVLVDFWATWCVPCESEIPHLVAWQQQYGAQGLQVIGLSMDDTSGPVGAYVANHHMQYPVGMADDRTIASFGGVLGLPVNVIVGRDGRILAKHAGVTDIQTLEREVQSALNAR